MRVNILLADDQSMFRETLRNMLHFYYKEKKDVIIEEAAYGEEILSLVTRYHPDLVLMEYKMPGLGRLSTFCKEMVSRSRATRILLLTSYSAEEIAVEAAVGGAHGYILKSARFAELLSAIDTVLAGGIWVDPLLGPKVFHIFLQWSGNGERLRALSRRELQILSLVAQGINNRQIGGRLFIDRRTVKNHITHIFAKLGVTNRAQATRRFLNKN